MQWRIKNNPPNAMATLFGRSIQRYQMRCKRNVVKIETQRGDRAHKNFSSIHRDKTNFNGSHHLLNLSTVNATGET